jgi:hypothetical protein
MNKHMEDTKYVQWEDGMYVMLDSLKCDYEKALIENSLGESVYFVNKVHFNMEGIEDCIGVYCKDAGLWWSNELKTKITRAQALYIATGETTCTKY